MARRKFAKLKALMFEQDVRQVDLVPVMGRGITYISVRLNGKEPWNTEDMKAIAGVLGIPRAEWLDYFMEDDAAGKAVQKGPYLVFKDEQRTAP